MSLKAAWFNALRDTALTPTSLEWLERVWRREDAYPACRSRNRMRSRWLRNSRFATCRMRQRFCSVQHERTQNPDRKATIRVRDAGAVVRSRRSTGKGVRAVSRRAEPSSRAMGRRVAPLPQSSVARSGRVSIPCARRSICSGRFSGPATSSSRHDGRKRRCLGTAARRCRGIVRRFLAGESAVARAASLDDSGPRPTSCSAPPVRAGQPRLEPGACCRPARPVRER